MGIGTAVGMLIVKKLLKMLDTKKVYIVCCLYGALSLTVLFLVSKVIGFVPKELTIPFLIINFFVGLQHGNTNLTPNVMIADCVDEIEWKTGNVKRGFATQASASSQRLPPLSQSHSVPRLLYGRVMLPLQT